MPPDVLDSAGEVRERAWLLGLVAVATGVQLTGLARVLPGEGPPPMRDSIIFEYYGWYLARGGRLYVDVWELKPPLSYQTTALLALLSGGDPAVHHGLSVAATVVAAVGCVAVVGVLVADLTDDRRAAVVGGLAVHAHPVVFVRPAFGFKPKFFVALAGLGAVALLLRDRPAPGGAAAAAAAGYWQVGAVFPLVALGLAARRGGRRAVAGVVAGGGLVAAAVVAPVVLRGGLVAMLAEVVLAPLLVGGGSSVGTRAPRLVGLLDLGVVGVLVGAGGVLAALAGPRRHRSWWLPTVWGWLLGHLLLVNLDYYPDLVVLVAVDGVAVGLLVGRLLDGPAVRPVPSLPSALAFPSQASPSSVLPSLASPSRPSSLAWSPSPAHVADRGPPLHPAVPVASAVLAVAAINVATLGGVAGLAPHPIAEPRSVAALEDVDAPYVGAEQRALFYRRVPPETCRVFVSRRHRAWLARTGADRLAAVCGRLPPGYRWLRGAVPPPLRGPAPG